MSAWLLFHVVTVACVISVAACVTSPSTSDPEFVFGTAEVKDRIMAARASMGSLRPEPIRLQGILTWEGSGRKQVFDRALDWPHRYRKQDGAVVHLLSGGDYVTNGRMLESVRRVAQRNVLEDQHLFSLLLLARPVRRDVRAELGQARMVDGARSDIVILSDAATSASLFIDPQTRRVTGIATPLQMGGRKTERRLMVANSIVLGGIWLPTELVVLVDDHEDRAQVQPAIGKDAMGALTSVAPGPSLNEVQ